MEEWKQIQDYPNYSVSSFGNVRSDKTGNILKPNVGSFCYLRVCLYNDVGKKTIAIHRLVGGAFIENPDNYKELDHVDNDKNNNRVDNLRWTTRGGNVRRVPKFKGDFSSKYRGVYYHQKNKCWCASLRFNNKKTHIGSYRTEGEACVARNEYILKNGLDNYINQIV